MDVGGWLRRLGVGQYEVAFRENEIDSEVLPNLTADDLKELGVTILGHRRKILTAIETLRHSPALSAIVATPRPEDVPERRQLTVMFCDLVGSTALAARLDPEDMGDLIRAFQGVVAATVTRFNGYVAKLMGDGALIYFGYPRAHEDDAESATRAGLGILEAVAALQFERAVTLEVHAGIATGLVVVGELMGEGEARERGVVGETPNLAARLQALAEPGSVVVAASTRRLLGAKFEFTALGPQALKGFAAPVLAWAVVRENTDLSRFEAARAEAMTPFVGREQEVALLLERWCDAIAGEGQVALLSGEAGIGKSRILTALRERIGSEHHIVVRYQCSPHHANDAFYPIVDQIRRAAGIAVEDPMATRLDKLETMVALSALKSNEIVPCVAALLSIPAAGRYPVEDVAAGEAKERTIAALIELFVGLTGQAPVLALLEDAHWIDPTSLEVFSRLVERLNGLRALLGVTFRPEFVPPWLGRAHVTALSLNRFGPRQAATMIDRVASGKALPVEVLEEIVSKTDGVPLFVEELTKTVLKSGLLREEGGSYVLARTLTALAIPSTLQDSLMARLDRLAPVKEIAQIGAAIGRTFSWRLLNAVAPLTGPALQDGLNQLAASELIYVRGSIPEATYVFKHALVQDTAYASLLRSRRQRIHADIARALVEHFADEVASAPAIIARHYAEAGMSEPAARHWLAAAELGASRSTNAEALRYADDGLAMVQYLKDEPDRQSLELALRLARANALLPLRGSNAPETVTALTEAKRLLDDGVGTDLQRVSVLYGLCAANLFAGQWENTRAFAGQIVAIADRREDTSFRLLGYRILGTARLYLGEIRGALETLQKAERYRDPSQQKLLSHRFGIDPGLAVLCYKVQALMFLGLPRQAAAVKEQMLAEASIHGHVNTVATCNFHALVWTEFLFGENEAIESLCAELIAYCAENKVAAFRLVGGILQACARVAREPTKENILAVRAAVDAQRRSGARVAESFWISLLAEASIRTGDLPGAEASLREAFAFVEQSGERCWLAEMHRLVGQIALKRPQQDQEAASASFLKAIEISRGQEARMLELRAATDLARLWRDSGGRGDQRALLEPILAAIEGGENTRDVRNARALLADLA